MSFFVRLTLVLAAVFAAFMVAALVVKIVLAVAVFAALAAGSFYLYQWLRSFSRQLQTRRDLSVR